jgi:uncharacterized Fe-S center protein
MHGYRYIDGVASLQVEQEQCVGCGNCVQVCPHRIFSLTAEGLQISERDLCMECGACARTARYRPFASRQGWAAQWPSSVLGSIAPWAAIFFRSVVSRFSREQHTHLYSTGKNIHLQE